MRAASFSLTRAFIRSRFLNISLQASHARTCDVVRSGYSAGQAKDSLSRALTSGRHYTRAAPSTGNSLLPTAVQTNDAVTTLSSMHFVECSSRKSGSLTRPYPSDKFPPRAAAATNCLLPNEAGRAKEVYVRAAELGQ